ncbi:unnamed protein product, partial [Dicrocoelium dendriticum]
ASGDMYNAKTKSKSKSKTSSPQSQFKSVLDKINHLESLIKDSANPSQPQTTRRTLPPSRDRCLIIMNAPESTKDAPAGRMLDDQVFLERLISVLFDEGEQGINIISAFRLGCVPKRGRMSTHSPTDLTAQRQAVLCVERSLPGRSDQNEKSR